MDHDAIQGSRAGEAGAAESPTARGRWAAARDTAGAVIGAVLGLVPHVLHHVGLVAGAALVTGAAGNALFFLVGLAFSVPLLLRLYRRFSSWWAPAIAVAVFAGLFTLSAAVIGPAITGESGSDDVPPPADTPSQRPSPGHETHH